MNTLALKPYLEAVRNHCDQLSKKELTDLFCQIAQEVVVKERLKFLEKLKISPIKNIDQSLEVEEYKELLSRIEGVIEDVIERQESIEDGSYYEENQEYGDYYEEESPDSLSEDQKEDIESLFLEIDQIFLSGNSTTAKSAYQELLGLFGHNSEKELDYEIYHSDISINWRETLSRYCRCVYEVSDSDERIEQVLLSMEIDQPVYKNNYDKSKEVLPSLKDIVDSKVDELSEWNDFLKGIKEKLKNKTNNRAFLVYLEAIDWSDGIEGITLEVRKKKISVGYLYLLDQLEEKESWDELAELSLESLKNIPFDEFRAYAASKLSMAGEKIGNKNYYLQGKRDKLFSSPSEQNLSDFTKESICQNVKKEELRKVVDFFNSEKEVNEFSFGRNSLFVLKIQAMLMLGDLQGACEQIDTKTIVGWSYSHRATGILYSSVLISLIKGNMKANTINRLFMDYISDRYTSDYFIGDEIRKELSMLTITSDKKEELFQFSQEIAQSRIDHIVSNKHRKAYCKAAATMGGYMECLILNDQKNKAINFLSLNRNQKYNRFSAFRSEIDKVLRNSPYLSKL